MLIDIILNIIYIYVHKISENILRTNNTRCTNTNWSAVKRRNILIGRCLKTRHLDNLDQHTQQTQNGHL